MHVVHLQIACIHKTAVSEAELRSDGKDGDGIHWLQQANELSPTLAIHKTRGSFRQSGECLKLIILDQNSAFNEGTMTNSSRAKFLVKANPTVLSKV